MLGSPSSAVPPPCSANINTNDSEATKRQIEGARYLFMAVPSVLAMFASVRYYNNPMLTWGCGLGGLIDAHAEYYWYMSDAHRVGVLGLVVCALVYIAVYAF